MQRKLTVHAMWDDEAKVWVASSNDVIGLATEAETLEKLGKKLEAMIPELLEANRQWPNGLDEVRFQVSGHYDAIAKRPQAH